MIAIRYHPLAKTGLRNGEELGEGDLCRVTRSGRQSAALSKNRLRLMACPSGGPSTFWFWVSSLRDSAAASRPVRRFQVTRDRGKVAVDGALGVARPALVHRSIEPLREPNWSGVGRSSIRSTRRTR